MIGELRQDVTKTRNYPDCPVMPTLVGSVGVLAAGWGCRWWAGRDKPKLVEASNPRRRWPRDPDDLEDAQKRPLRDPFRDAMLELEGEPDGAALITRRCELRRAAGSRLQQSRGSRDRSAPIGATCSGAAAPLVRAFRRATRACQRGRRGASDLRAEPAHGTLFGCGSPTSTRSRLGSSATISSTRVPAGRPSLWRRCGVPMMM